MKRKSKSTYPPDWAEISKRVKDEAGWKCVRCGHPHELKTGYVLTVHHLDMNPANNEWWNIVALCQRCHLHVQAKVVLEQIWAFEHSDWFKPYVAGYYASKLGLPTNREYVLANTERILAYSKGDITECQ